MSDRRQALFTEPEQPPIPCRRCSTSASYRREVVALFERDHTALHSRRSVFDHLVQIGACCHYCDHPAYVGLLIYHLRQDGVVERVTRGRYRYRVSDAATADFVYGKRRRKVAA